MEPLVSVIVPVYNMEKFIKNCADSVLSQSYSNIELILVNDGSKDNSSALCKEIAEKHKNVTLIEQENQGVSVARNNGINKASGKYVTFLDADDYFTGNALKALVTKAEETDADMTLGKISQNEDIPVGVFEGEEFLIKALEDNPVAYYSVRILYKREFIKDVFFLEGFGCGEDSYFVFECALKKPKVATIGEQVYVYYTNPDSATHSSFSKKRYDDVCTLLDKKEKFIKEEYPHLLNLFYHLKTKIQMMLLSNLSLTKGEEFKKMEKETLERFDEVKGYFKGDLPYSNAAFYNVLANNGYATFKAKNKARHFVKRILKR